MAVTDVHPRAEELAAFTLGTLGADALDSIEAHVAGCPSCQERAASAPGDPLIELLRCAHARTGRQTDTVTEAAQAQTPAPQMPASAADESDRPQVLDTVPPALARHERYRVVCLLGEGGMGAVYGAEHRVMQRPVALKIINRAFTANAAAVERFRREVRAAALLSHPNIVTTYDAEDASDTHFLVMEYVEGVTLGRLVKDFGPLPVAEACAYVRQAALGLQHAHERGMVHRDVKPDNLLRTRDGTVKVLDFGLAVLTAERGGGLTDTNVIMGTPDYLAPEQAEDPRSADCRADVYSLGCTLYHLLTGKVPYPAPTSLLKILAHREQPLPSIRQARPDVPAGLAVVLARMLAKKPQERYSTAGAVAAALEPFTRPAASPPRKRHPLRAALAAAALFAGLMLAGVVVYRIQTDKGELVVTTESDDVEVVVKQGGKEVRVMDTKTDKSITLWSGVYELELKGAPQGLKLDISRATLTRGETVLARIERIAKPEPVPLPDADGVLHRIRWNDGERFAGVAVSPDGRYFLAGRMNVGTVRVWDMATGTKAHEFAGYFGHFLPDGKVVTGSWDGGTLFRIYELAQGKLIGMMQGPNPLWNFRVYPDSSRLLSFSPGRLHCWDLAATRELFNLPWNPVQTPTVVGADGRHILYQANGKQPLRALDATTGKETPLPAALRHLAELEGVRLEDQSDVANGRRFLFRDERHLLIFDAISGKEVNKIDVGGEAGVLSGDGRRVLTGRTGGREFRLWDVDSSKLLQTLRIPKGLDTTAWVDFRLSGDGRFAVLGGSPDWLYVFRLPDVPGRQGKP